MAEAVKIEEFLQFYNVDQVNAILTTHWHGDHSGANHDLSIKYPNCMIVGGTIDRVDACTRFVNHGD